jgi:hypothetical protein
MHLFYGLVLAVPDARDEFSCRSVSRRPLPDNAVIDNRGKWLIQNAIVVAGGQQKR